MTLVSSIVKWSRYFLCHDTSIDSDLQEWETETDKKVLEKVFCLKPDFQVTLVRGIVKWSWYFLCRDLAIDSDLQEWETEAVDIDMGGLGTFYFDKKML